MTKSAKSPKKKGTKKGGVKMITLTKIKQFYMPVDAKSYKRMRAAGIPLLRFHESMLETVALLGKLKKLKATLTPFKDGILNPFLDRLSDDWKSLHEDTRVKIDSKSIRLETTHADASEKVEPVIEDLRQCVQRFFERWGYSFSFEASTKRGKHLIHIEYWFSESKLPVIHLEDDPVTQLNFDFVCGWMKFSFNTDDKYLNVTVHTSHGGQWQVQSTTRCLFSQVSNVMPMIAGLLSLTQKDAEMAERNEQTLKQASGFSTLTVAQQVAAAS